MEQSGVDADRLGDGVAVLAGFGEDGIGLGHPDEGVFEGDGDGADFEFEGGLVVGEQAEVAEEEAGADGGVAGHGEFIGGSEDAEGGVGVGEGGFEEKGGLGEVHFAGEGLHLVLVEAVGVEKDGELIAGKRGGGEDVKLIELKTGHLERVADNGDLRGHGRNTRGT